MTTDGAPPIAVPSLRKNFAWTLVGTVGFALCQWATLIAITKVGSTRAAGDWTLALAVTAPVFIFSQFKLRYVLVTDVRVESTWSEYLALRLLASSAALFMVLGVIAIAYRDATGPVILMIAASKALDGASDLIYGQEQRDEAMDQIARSQLGRGLTSLAAALIALRTTHSAAWAAAATALGYLPWLLHDIARLRVRLGDQPWRPKFALAPLRRLLRKVLPLGFVTAIGSLQINIPRYFLEGYATREELGVFGTMSYMLVFGNMVIFALQSASLPRLARQAAEGDWTSFRHHLRRMHLIGFALGIVAVGGALLFGEPVLRIVYSDEVARHADVLVWLAVTSWFLWTYVFLGTALDAMRRFWVQPWIHVLSASAITVASMLLIPRHGMIGAAWAMLAGYAFESTLYFAAVAIPLRKLQNSAP